MEETLEPQQKIIYNFMVMNAISLNDICDINNIFDNIIMNTPFPVTNENIMNNIISRINNYINNNGPKLKLSNSESYKNIVKDYINLLLLNNISYNDANNIIGIISNKISDNPIKRIN